MEQWPKLLYTYGPFALLVLSVFVKRASWAQIERAATKGRLTDHLLSTARRTRAGKPNRWVNRSLA